MTGPLRASVAAVALSGAAGASTRGSKPSILFLMPACHGPVQGHVVQPGAARGVPVRGHVVQTGGAVAE